MSGTGAEQTGEPSFLELRGVTKVYGMGQAAVHLSGNNHLGPNKGKEASSAEFVGEFWLGEVAEVVI